MLIWKNFLDFTEYEIKKFRWKALLNDQKWSSESRPCAFTVERVQQKDSRFQIHTLS